MSETIKFHTPDAGREKPEMEAENEEITRLTAELDSRIWEKFNEFSPELQQEIADAREFATSSKNILEAPEKCKAMLSGVLKKLPRSEKAA